MRQFILTGLLALALSGGMWAQAGDSLVSPSITRVIPAGTDTFALDSFPVVQESIRLSDSFAYTFQGGNPSYLIFNPALPRKVEVRYNRLPIALFKSFSHKDTGLILPEQDIDPRLLEEKIYTQQTGGFTPFQGLNSQGSISRTVSVGNNQDAVLNSNLNLQLSGNIGDNTELRASITDNSLPVQPDGYTQQLREFDRVYLELENPDFGLLRAGDYNMENQDSYLLRFQKRISGAGIFTNIKAGEGAIPVELQGGVARGKFARNTFQGLEGNQGPYKLTGANNEQFIIIISGSERVYIDGILQQRGQVNDYVIDYNAGEITFTALQPITKDKRIVVEFQYTEQNYLRSVAFGKTGYTSENWQTQVQFYSEQDSPNRQLVSDYSDEEKNILASVGDDLNAARVSTIQPASFSDDQVLYELRDTLGFDSVLVFSTDSSAQLYSAAFAFLGANQGNYRLSQNRANGRVFQWVAPVNGVPQGQYAPLRSLVAPNQLQVLTLHTSGRIGKNQKLSVDMAASNNDINLFSNLDEGNDIGTAGRFSYSADIPLKKGLIRAGGNFEYNQDRYVTIERIRRVEFARDWNLPLNYQGQVQLAEGALSYLRDSTQVNYQLEYLTAQGTEGFRNVLSSRHRSKKQVFSLNTSWLNSSDTVRNTDFLREQLNYQYFVLPKLWLGARSIGEWNLQRGLSTDSLFNSSYSFTEYEASMGFGDSALSYLMFGYLLRHDDTARTGKLERFSVANTYFARGQIKTNFDGRLNISANFRNLKILEPVEREIERTITSRVNYIQRLFNGNVVSSSFYETGAGNEPRRSFNYIEVPAGTGTYTHTDYNGNGIKELDEFEVAPTPDLARYVRVFTPNTDYVRTNIIKLGQNLNVNAPFSWQQKEDLRKFLSKFSLLFNYQLDRKTLLTGNTNQLNPFAEPAADSLIVALNNNFRNTIFFNRAQTSFGADYTFRQSENRTLLSFGVESREVVEHIGNVRIGLGDEFIFRIYGAVQNKLNRSGNFRSRNFSIEAYQNRYALSYQPNQIFTLTGSHEVGSQTSEAEQGNNLLVSQNSGLELNYNAAEKLSLLLQANYIFNGFEGEPNSPAGYEMLQALRPGNNATLNLTLQRTFLNNIVLSLNYNGRFSENTFAIHTGNVQVKAFF